MLGEPALVGVDPATGLDHHGGIVITGALPWRDYAATLVVAKEAADKMAVGYSHWPLVVITVRKRKNGQPVGLSTDLGVPDLTALPDWPKLLATLRGEFRHNNSQRTERECQRLRMTPRAGESEKTFQERCDRFLNALIPDIIIDLFGTELKDRPATPEARC